MARLSLPTNVPVPQDTNGEGQVKLIVTADDFGLHPAINAAVIQAHEIGIVTSCSIFPLGGDPSFDQAVEMALRMPSLEIGLHFCLVGLPGQPTNFGDFLPRFLAKKYPQIPVEAMVHQQIDLLERVGLHPTFISSHKHVHAVPDVMRAVCRAAKERGISAVRVPIDTPMPGTPISRSLNARGITEYAKRSAAIVSEYDLWHTDHFIGVAEAGHMSEGRLLTAINELKPGVTEISCHPGAHTGRLEAALKWGYDWEAERKGLISENARYKISNNSIVLTNFSAEAAIAAARQAAKASGRV